jgi:WD40 repeat protein
MDYIWSFPNYGGRVAIWKPDGTSGLAFKANQKHVVNCQLSPDNTVLATGGLTDDISIWSFPDGKPVTTLHGHHTAAFPIRFLNGGRTLLTQGYEGTLREWDTTTWECTRQWESPVHPVRSLTFSPDGSRVALATQGKVLLFDDLHGEPLHTLEVGTPATGGVTFSHDNRYLAVGAADRNLRVWELP